MKHTALLLTMLASLPLGACAMAPLEGEGDGQVSSSSDELAMWYVSNPAPTLIDFDTDPKGAPIADGTIIDTTYTSLGVTFSCIVCSSGHAFARGPGRARNGVTLVAPPLDNDYDAVSGAVRAEFSTPRSWVSIDVIKVMVPEYKGTPVALPWIEAYDAANNLIASAYYPVYGTPGWGQWQTLRIDDPTARIKSVRLSSQHRAPQVNAVFDNLSFNTDPYWVEVTPVQRPPIVRPIFPSTEPVFTTKP